MQIFTHTHSQSRH